MTAESIFAGFALIDDPTARAPQVALYGPYAKAARLADVPAQTTVADSEPAVPGVVDIPKTEGEQPDEGEMSQVISDTTGYSHDDVMQLIDKLSADTSREWTLAEARLILDGMELVASVATQARAVDVSLLSGQQHLREGAEASQASARTCSS